MLMALGDYKWNLFSHISLAVFTMMRQHNTEEMSRSGFRDGEVLNNLFHGCVSLSL